MLHINMDQYDSIDLILIKDDNLIIAMKSTFL